MVIQPHWSSASDSAPRCSTFPHEASLHHKFTVCFFLSFRFVSIRFYLFRLTTSMHRETLRGAPRTPSSRARCMSPSKDTLTTATAKATTPQGSPCRTNDTTENNAGDMSFHQLSSQNKSSSLLSPYMQLDGSKVRQFPCLHFTILFCFLFFFSSLQLLPKDFAMSHSLPLTPSGTLTRAALLQQNARLSITVFFLHCP